MGLLDGRVAIVTGAGRGIGRAHALYLAAHGAHVVVNDVGASVTGDGADDSAAGGVAREITEAGGFAVANTDDIGTWNGAAALIDAAVAHFGRLDALVNNAGIVRDRTIVEMEETEWDDVVRVHLKGHFGPTHFAARHWRSEAKAGRRVSGRIVHTSSSSGLFGNVGQGNYAAAKGGILTLNLTCALELERYGVKSNCVAPSARTRITATSAMLVKMMTVEDNANFDTWDPVNNSPLVAYLCGKECAFNGATFASRGGDVTVLDGWKPGARVSAGDMRWELEDLAKQLDQLANQSPEAAS
jgi:NAD(P)-dependent dehydrogenase (short-subunit alcohol dehydrogenase family)